MDIIESWVDEKQVRNLAQRLIAPSCSELSSEQEDADEDFIIIHSAETIAQNDHNTVAMQSQAVTRQNPGGQPTGVEERAVAEHSASSADSGIGEAHQKAIKALDLAAQKAKQGGLVKGPIGQLEGLKEEQGWGKQNSASAELRHHLGKSAGAIMDRDAVLGSLEMVVSLLFSDWGVKEVSISDRDGDIFVDSMRNPVWSQLTVSMTEPIRLLDIKQGAIGHGYMYLKLTAKEFLQVVVTSTSHGLLIMGMIRESRLSSEQVKDLVDSVRSIV